MSTFIPHAYQRQGAEFIIDRQRCALFWDMGLGKTGTTLTAMDWNRDNMLPALIVAPLRCVTNVWPDEIKKFNFDFSYSIIHGEDHLGTNFGLPVECNKSVQLDANSDIKITNYESLGWLVSELKRRKSVPFRTVIFDEFSKLKSPTSNRTNHAQAISKHCKYRIGLTGTPIPAGYHDLWSQTYVLDHGKTFGTYANFLDKAFEEDHFGRPQLKLGWGEQIEKAIAPFTLRGDAEELLDMPQLVEQTIRIDLSDDVMERYSEVEFGYLNGFDDYQDHTEAPYNPLRCLASGFLYHADPLSGHRLTEVIHQAKIDEIYAIRDEINRKPMLVAFNFRGEREALIRQFDCPYIDGTTSAPASDMLVRKWNAGKIPMLAVQPLSVGFGLNLQKGGRHLVWMSLPDSGEVYAQTVGRIYRQGQFGTVHVYRLVCKDTIEESIEHLLKRKLLNQQNLLDAMKERRCPQ